MADSVPVVYLLHGEDSHGMAGFVHAIQEKLGDPTNAEMNTTYIEGSLDLEALRAAASAVPFLAPRRVVILENASKRLQSQTTREKFLSILDGLPESTAMVLLEQTTLDKKHWLIKWAEGAQERAYVREYTPPKGAKMANWIKKYAASQGGQIAPPAASLMAEHVGDDTRMATLEVDKALAYVNFSRPVEVEDVEETAAFAAGGGDFFAFIDSIAQRDGRKAMNMLKRLLDEQDPLPLFFSLVGHFRLLLQTRELYENGSRDAAVANALDIHPYRAKKLTTQAGTLSLASIEGIYKRLQEYDLEIKTGQLDPELALETMIAALTG